MTWCNRYFIGIMKIGQVLFVGTLTYPMVEIVWWQGLRISYVTHIKINIGFMVIVVNNIPFHCLMDICPLNNVRGYCIWHTHPGSVHLRANGQAHISSVWCALSSVMHSSAVQT